MRVLGIDPGMQITGYGCVEMDSTRGTSQLVEAGVVRLKRGKTVEERLVELHDELVKLIEELQPRFMAVEKLYAHYRHPNTAIIMGHARGVILLAAARAELQVVHLPATQVKKAMTGNGHASKRQMQLAVVSQCGLPAIPEPPDVADAIAIALAGAVRTDTIQ